LNETAADNQAGRGVDQGGETMTQDWESCSRCQGLVVVSWVRGPDGCLRLWRCLNCGDYTDPVIRFHRLRARLTERASAGLRAAN